MREWLARWWRRNVIDDDPMDDEAIHWRHHAMHRDEHCTDTRCPCHWPLP